MSENEWPSATLPPVKADVAMEPRGNEEALKTTTDCPVSDQGFAVGAGNGYKIMDHNHVEGVAGRGVDDSMKRKRESPQKDECGDGNESAMVVFSPGVPGTNEPSAKRGRGRPKGSIGKSRLGDSGGGIMKCNWGKNFVTYVETVETGEDVVGRFLSFSQKGSQALCVLSATGPVSSVIISQPTSCGGTLRYEGRFEILSLSGSCTLTETSGARRKISRMSVSLAKPDGRVFGGAVAGSLVAAGPIQLVIGSFKQTKRDLFKNFLEPSATTPVHDPQGAKKVVEGEENCATPMSETSEPSNDGAEKGVMGDHNISIAALDAMYWNPSQTARPISDHWPAADQNAVTRGEIMKWGDHKPPMV